MCCDLGLYRAKKTTRIEREAAPFSFAIPFNPADVNPNARILLSAAITVDGKLMFVTGTYQPVINQGGTKADLTLILMRNTAIPLQQGSATAAPSTQAAPFSAGE